MVLRADVRTALRATMVHRHDQAEVFDSAFDLFWRDPAGDQFDAAMALLGENAPRQDKPATRGQPPGSRGFQRTSSSGRIAKRLRNSTPC